MPATKPTPAAAKVAAARAERNGGAKACTWRGLKLKLPPQLPATVGFDMAEAEASDDITPMFRFLDGLLLDGGLARVREKVANDGDPLDGLGDIFASLLDEIFGAYGVGLGESQASPSS